ncbi:hypothetical protein Tco_0092144 [Tanacetum coccineum]
MINQCLTGKTFGFDRPRYSVLQMLWGIITRTNVDYAKLMWEEFVQAIQTFLADKANLGIPTKKGKKTKPHVIPSCRFTKLHIYYLGRIHNIHQRSGSPLNLAEDDLSLGNIKFVPKGETDEVFGMQIPKEQITDNIKNAPYYNAYLEMVAKHDYKITAEKGGKKKPATTKQLKPKPVKEKSTKPAPAQKPKVSQEKPLKPSPVKKVSKGKVGKVRKGKSGFQLVDEEEQVEREPEPEPQGEGEEYDIERAIQMSLESFQAPGQAPVGGVAICEPVVEATRQLPVVEGKGKAIATDEQAAQSLLDLHKPKKTIHNTPSPIDAETGAATDKTNSEGDTEILNIGEEQGEDVADKVNLEEKTAEIDEGQAGSDPGKTPESRPPSEHVHMEEDQAGPYPGQSHVALAGPDPESMHDDFIATVYPQVHESLKHPDEEHVHVENPLSSTGTLSSMKNLDAYTYGDQFFNDKPTEEELDKANMETEVESMVTVLIHQASFSVPPLSTSVIDLTPPKHPDLASRVLALEQVCANFKKRHKLQDKTVQGLSSRVFTLKLRDLPHKIDEAVNEAVKEAVQIALQAPLKERFRDLSKADMKEILHQRMFESGTYQSEPEHVAFYEDLEASMDHDNRDEFLKATAKSRKRRRDDQDPPPPPDSDLSKKKRHDSDASGSKQPLAPQSSAWKTSDTREAPSSSSKQKSVPHSEQPVKDVPIPDDVNISDSEDIDTAHLPKIKTRPHWLKPVPEDDRPKTPELNWIIPPNDLPDAENNWADALAKSYKDPEENKLLSKTGDMGSFIKWYCKRIRKKKLTKADLEGPTYMIVRPFHTNSISLQFQMEECHRLLSNKIDLMNPEGHRVMPDVSKPLPLGGPPGQVTIQPQFFFNKDLEYLVSGSKERRSVLSISKLKAANYPDFGLEELVLSLWIESEQEYDISAAYEDYTIVSKPRAIIYKDRNDQKKMMRETEVHKFSDGTLNRILDKLDHVVKDFKLFKYNLGMETRIWSEDDRRRSKEFMEVIERRIKIRRIFRSLESFVSGRSKSKNKGIVPTEMELVLEQTQQVTNRFTLIVLSALRHSDKENRSVLTDSKVKVKMEMEIPRSNGVNFITKCSYSFDKSKDFITRVKRTSRSKNNQAFKIKKGMSMSVQMSQAQDGEKTTR